MIEDFIYIRRGDGSVERIEPMDLDPWIGDHPNEDFAIIRVAEDIVNYISGEKA